MKLSKKKLKLLKNRKERDVKLKIENHLIKKGALALGPSYSLTDDDMISNVEFERYLADLDRKKRIKEQERKKAHHRLTSSELEEALKNWSMTKLQNLWDVRENKLRTLYDCAILLANIRYKLGIDKIQKDPHDLLNNESITMLSDILEPGIEVEEASNTKETVNEDKKRIDFVKQTIREGQAQFRKNLISIHGLKCMVTGVETPSVLEAAHIIPYAGKSTNNIKNGLLLRTDIHRLYDAFLLSIDPNNLEIFVSPEVKDKEYTALTGKQLNIRDKSFLLKKSLEEHWKMYCSKI